MPAPWVGVAWLLVGAAVLAAVVVRALRTRDTRNAAVVVVGDVGRSPRMCYHAASLLAHGWHVRLVGHFDAPLPPALVHARVACVPLYAPPAWAARLPRALFPLVALVKVPLGAWSLFAALALRPTPAVIIAQTPPAIPTLAVLRLVRALCDTRLVVDWHNLGYTLLALKLGATHPLVRLAEFLEAHTGRSADVHLFVTAAMRDALVARWHLRGAARVLYDRPGPSFRALDGAERAACRAHFADVLHDPGLTRDDHALVVTSTSWTPDEDMDMLLDAASLYNRAAQAADARLPRVSLVITGKGPLRTTYEARFAARAQREHWTHVRTTLAWLAADDYPRLLGCVDVGVSLHQSSSGLDLPMKVVDLLGCRATVCALDYACLHELVAPGTNGAVFADAAGLAQTLATLLRGFPTAACAQRPAKAFPRGTPETWSENWDAVVLPALPRVQM